MKFVFKAKKNSENAFRILKSRAKKEIQGGKKTHGVWKEKISFRTFVVEILELNFLEIKFFTDFIYLVVGF
jgi:hypothetical protein